MALPPLEGGPPLRASPPPRIPILEDSHRGRQAVPLEVRRFLATPLRSLIALTPRQMRRLTVPVDTPSSPRRGVRGPHPVRTRTHALHQPHGPKVGELYQSTTRVCFLRYPTGTWRPPTTMWSGVYWVSWRTNPAHASGQSHLK